MEKKYFKLRLKSNFKVYPTILIITLVIIISIAIACVFLLQSNKANEDKHRISFGVVGDIENSYIKIGLNALKNIESSRFTFNIYEMTEDAAKEALEDREISGYVYIPEGYINSIFRGRNIPAKYVTLNAPEGFGNIISAEIAEMVSKIVIESQNGMYSMQNLANDYNKSDLDRKIDKLMITYINSILDRKQTYESTSLGIQDSLSFAGYYICGMLMLLMLLWGISCNQFFTRHNNEYVKFLNLYGVKAKTQVVCEYLSYMVITTITILIFAVVFGVIIQFFDFEIPELTGTRIIDCIFFVVKILPVIILITIIQTAIYELIQNTVAAVLVQFVLSIVLGYISGCFYPNYFFPEAVQNIAEILPVGAGFSYIRKVMSDSAVALDFCIVSAYSVFFFLLTTGVRKHRISGDIR